MRGSGGHGGSVYQRVLGDEFLGLTPQLQAYCSLPPAGTAGIGHGVYEVAGSRRRWLWPVLAPVLAFMAWRRILFPEFGTDVPFTVTNTTGVDGGLSAVRTFEFPRVTRTMRDSMRVIDGRLHDFIGRRGGLEVELLLSVVDGGLRMSSRRLWLRLGPARLPLPRLAILQLSERWRDDAQAVDVTLKSPLLGVWFEYRGRFSYRFE